MKVSRNFKAINSDFTINPLYNFSNNNFKNINQNFSTKFQEKIQKEIQKEINQIIKLLDYYGNSFSIDPSIKNLVIYKRQVQLFFNFLNKNTFFIKEISGRRLDYKIVNVINKKLEELSKNVIKREISRIELLAKFDEIRGIIIDLFF